MAVRHERHVDDGHIRLRRPSGGGELTPGQEERPGPEIVEVERELGLGVRGVQRRRGRAERADREQELDELRAGREGEGDAVAAFDPERRQLRRELLDGAGQLAVRERTTIFRRPDGWRVRPARE